MVASDYTLALNSDGSQHTDYPDGDKSGGTGPGIMPPDSVVASNPTESTIDLTWGYTGANPDYFQVVQWITGTSTQWDTVASMSGASRSYTATSLPTEANVGYKIRALSGGEQSAWSQEAWGNTLPASNPAPDTLVASNPTESTIDLTWTYAGSGESFEIEGYAEGIGTEWGLAATLSSDMREYTQDSLPAGYYIGFRIRAISGGQPSAWSNEAWEWTASGGGASAWTIETWADSLERNRGLEWSHQVMY
jgi:hypothetical protein